LGPRVTSISGAVLVSGGFIISIFANSVVYLYISMGVIVGMGFALLYQSFSVITALYFRKRLATAYAIGRSGMGLTFALAPFTQLLLDQYAWQGRHDKSLNERVCVSKCLCCGFCLSSIGAMLILGGLMLNLVASGMLLRPINVKPSVSNPTSVPIQKSPAISLKSSEEKEYHKSCLSSSPPLSNGVSKVGSLPSSSPPHRDIENLRGKCIHIHESPSWNPELTRLVLNNINGHEHQHDSGQCKPPTPDNPVEMNGSMNTSTTIGVPLQSSVPVQNTKVLDFSLLKDPFFCIYTWSLVFSQLAYFIPYFHLSARARNLGIDAMDASFFISVAGEANISQLIPVNNYSLLERMTKGLLFGKEKLFTFFVCVLLVQYGNCKGL
ncbi:hypothetical protein XENOCAPTIV_017282, partial [Xenoophorus captivus]